MLAWQWTSNSGARGSAPPACSKWREKAGPAVDFHEQIGQLDQRQARVDLISFTLERQMLCSSRTSISKWPCLRALSLRVASETDVVVEIEQVEPRFDVFTHLAESTNPVRKNSRVSASLSGPRSL